MAEKKTSSWEDKLDEKMKNLEKRVDEIGKKVEDKGEEFGKRVEEKAKAIKKDFERKGHHGHTMFWGIVLIVVGLIWLGNNVGWFFYDVPWFPVAMIAVGIYLIVRHWDREKSTDGKKSEKEE